MRVAVDGVQSLAPSSAAGGASPFERCGETAVTVTKEVNIQSCRVECTPSFAEHSAHDRRGTLLDHPLWPHRGGGNFAAGSPSARTILKRTGCKCADLPS